VLLAAVMPFVASPLRPVALGAACANMVMPLVLLFSGTLNDLSLLKEYANRQEVFDDALAQHLTILFGTWCPRC
jgi:hypothetical protein